MTAATCDTKLFPVGEEKIFWARWMIIVLINVILFALQLDELAAKIRVVEVEDDKVARIGGKAALSIQDLGVHAFYVASRLCETKGPHPPFGNRNRQSPEPNPRPLVRSSSAQPTRSGSRTA